MRIFKPLITKYTQMEVKLTTDNFEKWTPNLRLWFIFDATTSGDISSEVFDDSFCR